MADEPRVTYYKPAGIQLRKLHEVELTVDEYEALRLKDYECRDQETAAGMMEISQPTFHRLLMAARKKLAETIVQGKALRIQGGNWRKK